MSMDGRSVEKVLRSKKNESGKPTKFMGKGISGVTHRAH
jgi:hypothetical protein